MTARWPRPLLLASIALCAHLVTAISLAAQRPLAAAAPPAERFIIVPGMSRASYSVDEVFLQENNRLFTAVGVTTAVTGEVILDRARPEHSRASDIVVDLRPLTSDSWRRDRALREKYLDTGRFPHARLSGIELHNLPATLADGRPFSFRIVGDLSVHGITRRTIWRGEGTVAGDTLRGRATTAIRMSDFDVEVPRLLSLRSSDDVKLVIQFTAARRRTE